MRIVPIPCLKDNYAYLVVAESGDAAIVDPSEAAPVKDAIARERVRPRAIWATHHHWDHVGGNEELAREFDIDVVGYHTDRGRLPGLSRAVHDGEIVSVGRVDACCIAVPGHTLGAVSYHVDHGGDRAVFTGDTLFCGGCGRLFEGTAAQMLESLSRLASLPADTRVYCGHEYTEANLRFAAHVEPDNGELRLARADAARRRAAGEPTVGTPLASELAVNPFLRVTSAAIRASLGIAADADAVTAFAAIRAAKDAFR